MNLNIIQNKQVHLFINRILTALVIIFTLVIPSFLTVTLSGQTVPPGFTLSVFATGLPAADGLVFDESHNLYVASELSTFGSIYKITPSGEKLLLVSNLNRPDGLAYHRPTSQIFFSEEVVPGRIFSVDSLGNIQVIVPKSDINNPEGLSFSPINGLLYIAEDQMPGRIRTYSLISNVISTFTTGLQRPEGITFDDKGNLYVAETTTNKILKIDTSGNVETFVSSQAGIIEPDNILFVQQLSSFFVSEDQSPGNIWLIDMLGNAEIFARELSYPQGLAYDFGHNLYVSEQGMNRVLKISGFTSHLMILSLPDTLSAPNDTISIPVNIALPDSIEISSFEMDLIFDSSIISAISAVVDSSTILGQAEWLLEFSSHGDTLSVTATGDSGLSDEGVLFYATFLISDTSEDDLTSPLFFSNVFFNDGEVVLDSIKNGSIRVVVAGGDLDSSGGVQDNDASLILQYLTRSVDLTLWQHLEADVSDNGVITSLDASLILQFVAGSIENFPTQGDQTAPIAAGDISIPDEINTSGEEVIIPIFLSNGENFFSSSFEVLFDIQSLDLIEIRPTESTQEFISKSSDNNDGKGLLFLAGATGLEGNHSIMEIVFNQVPGGPSRTMVILITAQLNENLFWTTGDTTIIDFVTNIKEVGSIPEIYSLQPNFPNPFNPTTTIEYALPLPSNVILTIFNIHGEEVARLVNKRQSAGYHRVSWDATNVSSGLYIYRLQAGDYIKSKKMVVLK